MMNARTRLAQGVTAHGKMSERILPYEEPMRTWAGHGTGALCNVCGLAIRAHDIEYEVELAHLGKRA